MNARQRTTAERLGQLHRELTAEGIPDDVVDVIVRDAAHIQIIEGGFVVESDLFVADNELVAS